MGCRRAPAKGEKLEQKMEEHLKAIADGFWGFKFFEVEAETKRALDAGVPKAEIMKTLVEAFHQAVERYNQGEFCVAHLAAAGSILGPGCDLGLGTPEHNILALVKARDEYGTYYE